jgi:O-antigen/teichoic acid export membrane protein
VQRTIDAAENTFSPSTELTGRGHTALRNSLFGVLSRTISGFSRTGVLLLIASRYGPAEFGNLALAISLAEIFRSFSEFGIDTIAIRYFSEPRRNRSEMLGEIVSAKLLTACCCYLISIAALMMLAHTREERSLGAIANLSLLTANLVGAFTSYFQSQLRMAAAFPAIALAYSGFIVVSVVAIHAQWPLYLIVGLIPAFEAVNCSLLWYRSGHTLQLRVKLKSSLALLRESLPLGLMSAMVVLYFRLDSIIIFRLLGNEALGLYAAGSRLVEPALMVPHAFSITLLAVLSNPRRHSVHGVVQSVLHSMWPAYLFIGAGVAGVLLYGGSVLQHFGPNYLPALPVLKILACALVARTANITLTAILNSRGMYSTLARITFGVLAVNVVLALWFVSKFGIRGAAWAALVTELFNLFAQISALEKKEHGRSGITIPAWDEDASGI